jgi:hypothetical protein
MNEERQLGRTAGGSSTKRARGARPPTRAQAPPGCAPGAPGCCAAGGGLPCPPRASRKALSCPRSGVLGEHMSHCRRRTTTPHPTPHPSCPRDSVRRKYLPLGHHLRLLPDCKIPSSLIGKCVCVWGGSSLQEEAQEEQQQYPTASVCSRHGPAPAAASTLAPAP